MKELLVCVGVGLVIGALLGVYNRGPEAPANLAPLIAYSDDLQKYREEFGAATKVLIESGRCTEADFREMGGWTRSVYRKRGFYFTYCGNHAHVSGRVYFNVKTGRIE